MAATGKQLKQSVKVFHNLMLYRLLPIHPERAYHLKKNLKRDNKLATGYYRSRGKYRLI